MSWKDAIKGVQYEMPVKRSLYPRFYYHNGERARTGNGGTNGEWYIKQAELDAHGAIINGHPWAPKEKFSGEPGWIASEARIAPIMVRSQAFMVENDVTTWLPHYTAGARIYTEILCWADGISTPAIFCLKGMTAKAINGKGGIISTFRKDAAEISSDASMSPPWTFYIPMMAPVDKAGRPVYTDTGYKSFVTMPVLGGSQSLAGADDLEKLFVGDERLLEGSSVALMHAKWKDEKRGNDTGSAPAGAASDGDTEAPW
jgi:hypothetical protein